MQSNNMLSLTQCWYTRTHVPEGRGHRESDESHTSHCRHCGRPIVRRSGEGQWRLNEGIDLDELAESTARRFLYLLDATDDFIIARFPVNHLEGEDEIEAYKTELRAQHGADIPGSPVVLKDSADRGEKRPEKRCRS